MITGADVSAGESPPPFGLFGSGLTIGVALDDFPPDDVVVEGVIPLDDDAASALGSVPAVDVAHGAGAAGWLAIVARARSQSVARELEAVHALGALYRGGRGEFAADEVANALGWSRTMAAQRLELADDVIDRLPALGWALRTGDLDEVKVRAIAETTRAMPDDLARAVTAEVLPSAAGLSRSTLIDLVESTAITLDADWARRRELAARRGVRMVGVRNPTGTADVAVRDLNPVDAAAMIARVDALAGPIRKAALAEGLRAPVRAVRSLVSLRLQDGTSTGLDDDALIEVLVRQLPAWLHDYGLDTPDNGGPDNGGPDNGGPDNAGPGNGGPDNAGPDNAGPDDGVPNNAGLDDGVPNNAGPDNAGHDDGGCTTGPDPHRGGPAGGPGPTSPATASQEPTDSDPTRSDPTRTDSAGDGDDRGASSSDPTGGGIG